MTGSSESVRWIAKKWARTTVAVASCPSTRSALRRVAGAASCPRVLTYHRFGESPRDPFCVSAREFERQMEWLAERGLAMSLAELEAHLAGPVAPGSRTVLVTIDDGCPSVYSAALPVLRHYGIPAVVFVPAGEIGAATAIAAGQKESPEARMSWAQLDALVECGVTIGSHAWTHRSLGRGTRDEVREQAERSRETLRRRTGQDVASFAYPFGTRADYNAASRAALAATGYRLAFTSQHGAVRPGADPLELPRIKVEGGEGLRMFRRLLAGGLDAWRWVDRALWRLQASEA